MTTATSLAPILNISTPYSTVKDTLLSTRNAYTMYVDANGRRALTGMGSVELPEAV